VPTATADAPAATAVAAASSDHTVRRATSRRAAAAQRSVANASRARGIVKVKSPMSTPTIGSTIGIDASAANIAVTSLLRVEGMRSGASPP
jgi:hypothetical protein